MRTSGPTRAGRITSIRSMMNDVTSPTLSELNSERAWHQAVYDGGTAEQKANARELLAQIDAQIAALGGFARPEYQRLAEKQDALEQGLNERLDEIETDLTTSIQHLHVDAAQAAATATTWAKRATFLAGVAALLEVLRLLK